MRAIGLDLGGSFVKRAVLDVDARRLAQVASVPFPPFLPDPAPGARVIDPQALVATVRDQIARVREAEPTCEALFLCGQMHGLVVLDAAGAPIGPASTWQDRRSLEAGPSGPSAFERLNEHLTPADRAALGDPPKPGYPLALLFHLRSTGALPPGARVASLLDYVLAALTGEPPQTDPTNASAMGAYRWEAGDWHTELLARLGLADLVWPAIVPSGARIGHYQGLRVHAALGDQQAALLGALLAPGELSLNVGTGSQASMLDPAPAPGPYQIRPFPGPERLKTITHLPSGRALEVLFRLVTELCPAERPADSAAHWQAIEARVASAEPGALKANLAFFPSRLGDRGSLTDIQEGHFGVGELFAAAYDAMAAAYADAAQELDARFDTVVCSGGLPHRLGELRRRIAARFDRPIRLSACQEETLLGLLCLALGDEIGQAEAREALRALSGLGHAWLSSADA